MSELFSWDRFIYAFPRILSNLPITLKMILYSEVFGIVLGIVIAIIRLYKVPILSQIDSMYISFMRGTPILVQLLVVFYGVPTILLDFFHLNVNSWDKFIFATIALTLNESAMLSEIFRSSIISIPHTQFEAGYSVGLTWWQTFRRIILPQAIQVAIPSYGVNLVILIQSTSLAYTIGVIDLMGRARAIGASTRHSFEAYVAVTIIYVIFSLLVKLIFQILNKKLQYGNRKQV